MDLGSKSMAKEKPPNRSLYMSGGTNVKSG